MRLRLPSLVRTGGRQREHVAERLGIERLPLREGADARVDGGEEGAQRAQAGGDERARLATPLGGGALGDRKSTRLNSSHSQISYAVFCLKKKKHNIPIPQRDNDSGLT